MKITVNTAMIDYLSVTTKDQATAHGWKLMLECWTGLDDAKIKRYEGFRGKDQYSSIFIGRGVGKLANSYILQVSGYVADGVIEWVDPFDIKSGLVKVTRIDVQVTIDQPEGWSQLGYFSACEEMKLKPEIRRSPDPVNKRKELITVYTGTRKSGRYNRLYQKVMQAGNLLIRYETEYSRGYAKSIAYGIISGATTREAIIKGEIRRRKIAGLEVFNLWQCKIFTPKQEKRIEIDKRGEWLVRDILPVFNEYIQRSDADPAVAEFFMQAIENSY